MKFPKGLLALLLVLSVQAQHQHSYYGVPAADVNANPHSPLSQADMTQLHQWLQTQGVQQQSNHHNQAQPQQQFQAANAAASSFKSAPVQAPEGKPVVIMKECCPEDNVLTVQGKGNVKYNTTLSRISLGAEHEGLNETAAQVMAIVSRNAAAAVAALNSLGVRELQTTSVSLTPTYTYPKDAPPFVSGYRGSTIVSYLVDTSMAGVSIDKAVSAGASTVQSVSFEAEPDVVQAARMEALRDAVADANSQADAVLGVMNYKRGVPKSININYVSPPAFTPLNFNFGAPQAMMAVRSESLPIEGGTQEVTSTVQMEYNIDFGKHD
jgi:hypothetical protein